MELCETCKEIQEDCPKEKKYISFMMGLKNLDLVLKHILGMQPLPIIQEIFSKVWREECRKKVILGESPTTFAIDNSTLTA